MYLLPTGTYSASVRVAPTLMSACIFSLTKPGFTARGHMSRRRRSILSSITSKLTAFNLHHTYVWEKATLPITSMNKLLYVCRLRLSPTLCHPRFEFDVSLEEAKTRKLDISVKNGKMFHSRERKDIGMVGNT